MSIYFPSLVALATFKFILYLNKYDFSVTLKKEKYILIIARLIREVLSFQNMLHEGQVHNIGSHVM